MAALLCASSPLSPRRRSPPIGLAGCSVLLTAGPAGRDTSACISSPRSESTGQRESKSEDPAYTAPPPSSAGLPGVLHVCAVRARKLHCARACVCVSTSVDAVCPLSLSAPPLATLSLIPPRHVFRPETLPQTRSLLTLAAAGDFNSSQPSLHRPAASRLMCHRCS